MKKTLLLDVDGVIADCSKAVHVFAETLFQRSLPDPGLWVVWEHDEAMCLTPEESRHFHLRAQSSHFPWSIGLYPGAAELIEQLKEKFDVCFVTAPWRGNNHWVPARDELLRPFELPIIYTSEKHRIIGDILVDDKPATIERGGPWRGYLYSQPWNHKCGMPRITSLKELL